MSSSRTPSRDFVGPQDASGDVWTTEMPVIIAANRLPVRLFKVPPDEQTAATTSRWRVEWAGDRMIESQNTLSHYEISERATIKFVGRVVDVEVPLDERQEVELLLRELNCYPVFLEVEEAKLYYEDYCKQTLWPTFHNVVDVYSPVDVVLDVGAQQQLAPAAQFWNPGWQKVAWQAYSNVNQLFAHKICELYEPGDIVWIQDYHLLLTPSYIVRKLRTANVGLFLHVPFPSSEVFRTLSMRKELLRGMLNADHIGFHLFEYARHFMSACRRILGLSYEPILRGQLGIDYGGRRVAVTCSHMAIDVRRIEETLTNNEVRETVVALRQKYRDKKIFSGCDTIERLKGIPSKMLAFDGFLSRCPDFIGKVVLIQKGIHRRGRVTDYLQSKKEIELAVEAINNKHRDLAKGNVVDYEEVDEFPYKSRVALWRVTDVQITTKLTDQELAPGYRTSTSRAIFLDYYRTLAPDVSKVMGVRWPDVPLSALATLEQLCKDPRNTVFIVSGCNCDLLTQKFGGVPGLGLVAEHGYFIRRAVLGNDARIGRPWERHGDVIQSDGGHQQWRVKAERIIQLYVDRTNGSTLELRRSAVLFRYGKSDFDFGALQAAELKEHLEGVFEGWPLNVVQGKDYIEVRPEGVGKGKLVGHLLAKMRAEGNPADFVLCIGDDVADELMFEQLKDMAESGELPKG
ncbi:hypothetical protein BBO99_00003948 [Phytophthora kernoviae]|uniref:Uncharacterized protein n=2 Tax=Phytophthora kernoviae TaxID=325452 RepID=A0A3R7H4B8_9STRA|nr:hypothetical protein G195_004937 [Phytophthora kernoviae 00238/432]KAG2526623.1 hypothetical protein JM16_003772 [Phytophthora kernoviae]KAG2528256.1 hypothetical protein JM18_003242 [Phytophthora kernoviae]RLN15265.1 hypothetical protein BBI17_003963 [Phytophthora kernoviae]RLN81159.1 hypothetical protein BBO99_00003948 [Phytophthora kernoviae]